MQKFGGSPPLYRSPMRLVPPGIVARTAIRTALFSGETGHWQMLEQAAERLAKALIMLAFLLQR